MVIDPVSNLINGLKNASLGNKEVVEVPYTKMSQAILEALQKEGLVGDVEKHGKKVSKKLSAKLKYEGKSPVISGVKRVSKFSKRVYKGAKDIKTVKNGYGIGIISTPKGILSDKEARKQNIGGEVLFEIW